MKKYTVKYKIDGTYSETKEVTVMANSKEEAYDLATYELIPEIEKRVPFGSWVSSVEYKSGKVHNFNTCLGCGY